MSAAKPIILTIERKARLKQYVLACIDDGALSWADLANPIGAVERIFSVFSHDARTVAKELMQEKGGSFLRTVGTSVGRLAEDFVTKRSRK